MKTLIAALALGSIAVSATAETPRDEPVQMEVAHSDLDLATAKGQKRLDRRIKTAARKACGYYTKTTGSWLGSPETQRCVAELTARAREQFAILSDGEGKGG